MAKRQYFIHRISHQWELSYSLLEAGYLSIGWSIYLNTDILEKIENGGKDAFKQFMADNDNARRSRWNLWYFSQFAEGDYIVVPLFDQKFAVCEVTGKPMSVKGLDGKTFALYGEENKNKHITVTAGKNGIINRSGETIDIGFVVPVKNITGFIPRSYADAKLVSRMKIRQATARIDDLAEDVEQAAVAKAPVNIYDKMLDSLSKPMDETIKKYITPENLEKIIRWYMYKKGADNVWIPSKNERGKDEGADADVIAEFNDLGLVYYIQVKNHTDTTSEWAVEQIIKYKERQPDADDVTYIAWVVSTVDDFNSEAVELSRNSNVRLINKDKLIRMILNVGLDGI